MARKPTVAAGYSPAASQLAREAMLCIATKLGDFHDDIVIVGGLVPGLLVPQSQLPPGRTAHVGTMDVDLGLAVAILDDQRYHELCERLRGAGFQTDDNDDGVPTNQRWRIEAQNRSVTVDFLIPPTRPGDRGGKLRNLEKGFAAVIVPGLELAFVDRQLVTIDGETIRRERTSRDVWVCGAGAYTVLKALAHDRRGENKDAYDLVYILQNYGNGIEDVYRKLQPLLASPSAQSALAILERDFAGVDSVGAMRVAEFLGDAGDDAIRADAAGAVRSLLELCRNQS